MEKLRFKMTCGACPEQYDVFLGEEQVGYVRLRHGFMAVACPDYGGKTVYEANPKGDGCFDADERDYFLRHAAKAILDWIAAGRPMQDDPPAPAPNVEYVLEGFYDPFGSFDEVEDNIGTGRQEAQGT